MDYEEQVVLEEPFLVRTGAAEPEPDRHGMFRRRRWYSGWRKSIYEQARFDSRPERNVALLLDDAEIDAWVRVETGEIPLAWDMAGRGYNPDFVVAETSGDHYLVEVKGDDRIDDSDTRQKAQAARQWANVVNAAGLMEAKWHYALVSETDVTQARGSWKALRQSAR